MTIQKIDVTERYNFKRIIQTQEQQIGFVVATNLKTTFIHSGNATLEIMEENGQLEKIALSEGEGFVITPGVEYKLNASEQFTAYEVSSEVKNGEPIIEIIDTEDKKEEVPLPKYKIIKDPKKVVKPWGHELWIMWTKDYHVMKQIGMNAGNRSSLQFHREKLETNYLQEGEADVIDGYRLNPQASEEEVQESSIGINFDDFKNRQTPGTHWTSIPGTVHRVIAVTDYLAYEVSTPELDDVIRLQDDSGRNSGRIISEHIKYNK